MKFLSGKVVEKHQQRDKHLSSMKGNTVKKPGFPPALRGPFLQSTWDSQFLLHAYREFTEKTAYLFTAGQFSSVRYSMILLTSPKSAAFLHFKSAKREGISLAVHCQHLFVWPVDEDGCEDLREAEPLPWELSSSVRRWVFRKDLRVLTGPCMGWGYPIPALLLQRLC